MTAGQKFIRGRGTRFSMVPYWVGDRLEPEHRATGIALYATLIRYADHETAEAWPSRERLGEHIGKSPATVKRTIARLIEVGAVERIGQRKTVAGTWSSNRYFVHFDPPTVGHG